ncbi:MAG: hypothetical protein C4289_10205, partial [Chloroflexota bacterium]
MPLRIVLAAPPPGVLYCLQRSSRADCVGHRRSDGGDLRFDLSVEVRLAGAVPDFRGPLAQGRRGERYIAMLIGTLAGDAASSWTRGAKIPLSSITRPLLKEVCSRADARLTATFPGRARGGGPSCATLRPTGEGWQ